MVHNKVIFIYKILNAYGLRFCLYRTHYALKKKIGLFKRQFPARSWREYSLSDWVKTKYHDSEKELINEHLLAERKFFFDHKSIVGINKQFADGLRQSAGKIVDNEFRYFFNHYHSIGAPPDWFLNPVTGKRASSRDRHWCDINFFDPEVGDIKFIWEPSRFAWVYTLVRAYAATSEEKYIDKFWWLFEDWLEKNQPNTGPNYSCGQECSIRLFGMCFAFYAVKSVRSSSPERMRKLALAIAVHADRIEKNIEFAISTNTNHSITEAVGIYTAGLLFPQFKGSERWLTRGKKILEKETLRQIYSDGGYIQHSMNYHRLMLQDIVWAIQLGRLNNDLFSDSFINRVEKATEFLYQMVDGQTGRVPNYGANDGAIVIPLNTCNYLDYRPVIQTSFFATKGVRTFTKGPWDEDLNWLFGPNSTEAETVASQQSSCAFPVGGYYTIRNRDNWALFRCHTYVDRPSDGGMLHMDLWWKGLNILRDAGSYMYNCPLPWSGYFGSTQAHNTATIDGEGHLKKLVRFMSTNWTRSKLILNKEINNGDLKLVIGEHYGYCYEDKNLTHRRGIVSLSETDWLIIDDLIGDSDYSCDLHWHIGDFEVNAQNHGYRIITSNGPVDLGVICPSGKVSCTKFVGDENEPAGWQSLYYGSKQKAPTLRYSTTISQCTRMITTINLGAPCKYVELENDTTVKWSCGGRRNYTIELEKLAIDTPEMVTSVKLNGTSIDLTR